MNRERRELEEIFASRAADPGAWVELAREMKVAAEPILKELLGIWDVSQGMPEIRLRKLAYHRAYMLLMGLCFENVLKGIAVKQGPLARDKMSQEMAGHSLTAWSRRLNLELSPSEEQYLHRLEVYVHWAGRFPVSKKPGTYVGDHAARKLTIEPSDPRLGSALFERLMNVLESPD